MKEINLENSQIAILVESDNKVYMTAMKKDDYEAISLLTKRAIKTVVPINRTKKELRSFLGV